MGKSIVHCAECGNAIREEDFAKGKASIIDSRSYCSTCRPVPQGSSRTLDLRKSSTARLPLASGLTPRQGTPIASQPSRRPLLVAGGLLAVALAALLVFAWSRKRAPAPADPGAGRPAATAPVAASARPPAAARSGPEDPKPQGERQPNLQPPPGAPAAKLALPGKPAPPIPWLTNPLEGATFEANDDIPIEAQTRDPEGRIARVEFWQGSTKLGEAAEVPYRWIWKGVRPAGVYELRAKSIDREGLEAASEGVRVTLKPAAEEAKATPAPDAPALPAAEPAKEGTPHPEPKPEPKKDIVPQVDPKKVDLAIKKGTQYLVGQVGKIGPAFAKEPRECSQDGLLLWTFVHVGVPESSTGFRHLFKAVTEGEIRRTYEVALQAMILEEMDRVRYQERLQQCAQFLADNECPNGQWGYGDPPSKDTPTIYGALPVPTTSRPAAGGAGERQKPLVVRKLKITPRRTGPAEGDNSNSQYAALGIRACADAGILFPEDMLRRARHYFRSSAHAAEGGAGSGVATGMEASAPPQGWCYGSATAWNHKHGAYGSMTAGAIGALAIYDTLLGEDWRKDPGVASGLSWLARNFSVTINPGPPSEEWAKNDTHWAHFYYLYALERAGVLCRTEWIGRHAWYAEGTTMLLAGQGKDGSWNGSPSDTCFAILFLKRVTRPLEDVASQDSRK